MTADTETRPWTIERDDGGTFLCSNKAPWIIEGPLPDDAMTRKVLDYLNVLETAAEALEVNAKNAHNSDDVVHFCDFEECTATICVMNRTALRALRELRERA